MATVRQLQRRINELEAELQQLTSNQRNLRQTIEREYEARIRQLERDMQETARRNKAHLEQEFAERTRRLREELYAEMRRRDEELRRADAEAQAARDRLMAELERANEELRQQVEDMRRHEQQRSEAAHESAEEAARQAQTQAAVVEQLPHEFFCPGQLGVLVDHVQAARSFMDQGMHEAAVATADAALAELQILELTVREQQRQWEELFGEYRRMTRTLGELLDSFERTPQRTPLGLFLLENEDWQLWSSEEYAEVRRQVNDALGLVEGVERHGVEAYLAGGGAMTGRQLVQGVGELHRLAERLTAVTTCITSEMFYSDGREMLADQAEAVLDGQGMRVLAQGYRGDNPLETFVVELSVNDEDLVRLSFVPRRDDGVAVGNVCLVSLDVRTTPGAAFVRRLADDVVRLLRGGIGGAQVMWDGQGAREMVTQERQFKDRSDPARLARRLERKYR